MTAESFKAPKYLSAAARRWYSQVASAYELAPHHRRLLELAARSWDRAEQARKILAKDGLTFADRHGAIRAHPGVAIERDSQLRFARLVRELALGDDAPVEPYSRPPRVGRKD